MQIEFDHVGFTYPSGVEALRGVSLTIPTGERLGIVGQNGAGKTTLVRHLNAIFLPTSGSVRVGDWETKSRQIAELSARVGYVFQNPDEQLFARTVRADVAFGPKNLGFDEDRAAALVESALARTGLSAEAETHPHHLSLSERKRVAIAAVLAMDTPIVVLDEPTTGQDERGVRLVAALTRQLADEGRTVVAITHDMDFCAENFERVVVMAHGQVHADGSPGDVFSRQDALERAAVEAPQIMRLARDLGWKSHPLTVDAFVSELARRGGS